jgi:hypothetical protein
MDTAVYEASGSTGARPRTAIELIPDTRLTRRQAAGALTAAGYLVSINALAGYAHRGEGGPPYRKFGRSVLYAWDPTLRWAKDRTTEVPA